MENIEIVKYEEKYAEELSNIILENMYEINIKEQGKDVIDKLALHFSKEEIIKNFPKRVKCLVALNEGKVVGTASIDRFRGDTTGSKYIILTVFVNMKNHNQGIGRKLIENIETIAKNIGCKELVIPSSVYGCEFYRKFGFDYINGKKVQNEDKEYMLVKRYE